jgi:hypothetical protein
VDKKFVRHLNARLRRSGYETWLDEHELVAGDPLGRKIAEGLRAAKVILVVVSAASVKSRWLRYELNLATERMVKGECRVIPVVIDDSNLPAEVLGLLYADFRSEFKHGYKGIRTALQHENARAEAEARFWIVARRLTRAAFGGSGSVSIGRGYAEQSYDIVHIAVPGQDPNKHMNVFFEIVSNHVEVPEPLDEEWWRDFRGSMDDIPERLFLVVTDRPITFEVVRPDNAFPAVSYREFRNGRSKPYAYAVLVDCSVLPREQWPLGIDRSRSTLMDLAPHVSSLKVDKKGRNWSESLTVWTGEKSI